MPSPEEAWGLMVKAPSMYKEWWLNLVTKDPIHVFIETTLVLSLIYMVISGRTKDWRDELKKTLTRTEEEELLKAFPEYEEYMEAVPSKFIPATLAKELPWNKE